MVTCTYYLNPPAAISINGWKYQARHYCAYANGLPFLFCQRVLPFTLNIKLLNPRVNFWRTNYMNSLQQVLCKLWFIYYLSSSMSLKSTGLKTSTCPANISCFPRRLQDVLKTSLRRICNTSSYNVFKTSSRRLPRHFQDVFAKGLAVMSSRRLGRQKKCYTEDVFKTSSVRLYQDECLLGVYLI